MFDLGDTILSNSSFVVTLHLPFNFGRDVLGMPMISRHLFRTDLKLNSLCASESAAK